MNIEHITAPVAAETPQSRYATLHRALDQGIVSDELLSELAEVALELGRKDEALWAYRSVRSASERLHLRNVLYRHGVRPQDPPARSAVSRDETSPRMGEEILDAVRFQLEDPLGAAALVAAMLLPIVAATAMVVGGPHVRPLVCAGLILPAGAAALLLGCLGARVVRDAVKGLEDPPRLPRLDTLVAEGVEFWRDLAVLATLHLTPGALLLGVGALPSWVGWSVLVAGAALLPLAFGHRLAYRRWDVLDPIWMMGTVWRAGTAHLGALAGIALWAAPAVACAIRTAEARFELRLMLVGPLAVAPLLMTLRLIGRVLHLRAERIATQQAAPRPQRAPAPPPAPHARNGACPARGSRAVSSRPPLPRPEPARRSLAAAAGRRIPPSPRRPR